MKIVRHEIGYKRWHLTLKISEPIENDEFPEWMQANYPDCMCVRRWNHGWPYWEVRGSDPDIPVMIQMRWSSDR